MTTQDKAKAAWLDLRLPGRAVEMLRLWGQRLGMSAEGMARMLLLMRVHEMLGDELARDDALVHNAASEAERSKALWTARLQSIGTTSDELPAPVNVNAGTRLYHANDFDWPEGGTPSFAYAHITEDGRIGVSRQAHD